MERVLGTPALFATAYGNVGSSIYYALGLTAVYALGLTPLVFVVAGVVFAATAATYAEGTVRFPEAGGSSSFARHGFNELVSFSAAWSQMLVYIVTIATSAFFVPHYLSIFWEPLRENPWDIVGGAVVIVLLVTLNVVGVTEAAKLSIGLAVIDFGTQVLLVLLGFALVFSPDVLVNNVHWGTAPTWANLAVAIPVAMLAYTGVETVSNLAEEAREPERSVPNAYKLVAVAVFAIYFTLPLIALSALPVKEINGELTTLLALPPEQGGFANDPILGVVDNLGLEGGVLRSLQLYVGVLAATILFIATNAGIIGASRITYSMSTYRQMPEVFRRLHPRLKTPYIALVLFAGIAPIVILLPGDVNFVGTLYSLGATLSFTVAHAAMVRLRMRPDPAVTYRARPNLRLRGCRLAALRDLRRHRDRCLVPRDPRAEPSDALGRARVDRRGPRRLRDLPPLLGAGAAHGDREGATRLRRRARARVPADRRPHRPGAPVRRRPRRRVQARGRARSARRGADGDRDSARAPPRRRAARRGAEGQRRARRGRRLRRDLRRARGRAPGPGTERVDGDRARGAAPRGGDHRPGIPAQGPHESPPRRVRLDRRPGDAEGALPRHGHGHEGAERGMNWYSQAVIAFGAVFVAIGIALLVVTAVHGGGILGYLLGGLFIALGVARIQLERKRRGG